MEEDEGHKAHQDEDGEQAGPRQQHPKVVPCKERESICTVDPLLSEKSGTRGCCSDR